MSPEFIKKVKQDYDSSNVELQWESYLAGYIACLKRFGGVKESGRETKSKLGYTRIGLK